MIAIIVSIIIILIVIIYFIYKIFKINKLNTFSKTIDKRPIRETFREKKKNSKISMTIKIGNKIIEEAIIIKLYDDKLPLTCKNFKIFATEGFNGYKYKGSQFHRIIKDFMIQGGDVTNGDGTGSISIYGDKFEDEGFPYSHDRAGLLSMANSGPDTNGSQFFITTKECHHLDGKHVVFGEVISGYETVRQMESVVTDSNDKPYEPVIINNIQLL